MTATPNSKDRVHNDFYASVGQRIKVLRVDRHFSQEDVADHLDISTQSYGRLERGTIKMTALQIHQIAEFLSVSAEELLHDDALPINKERALHHMFSSCPKLAQEWILRFCAEIYFSAAGKEQLTEDELLRKIYKDIP